MTFRPFVPTHRITRGVLLAPITSEVMLDADPVGDGPAYTHAEFITHLEPRFRVCDGEWHLDGNRCTGLIVEPLVPHTTPETTARILSPESDRWLRDNDYPESVRLRRDGSVVVRGLFGARAYHHIHQFCRAWRVMVSFTVTREIAQQRALGLAFATLPDELIVRYTGEAYALYPGQSDQRFSSLLSACRDLQLDPDRLYRGTVRASEDHDAMRNVQTAWLEHDHLLWELSRVWNDVPPTSHEHQVNPYSVTPLRGAIDGKKVSRLAAEMTAEGWTGVPLLVERMPYGGYVAWTGRHRILAARQAKLGTIPILTMDPLAWARVHGSPCPYGAVYDTRDDLHRAVSLAMCGDLMAASLMAHELSKEGRR